MSIKGLSSNVISWQQRFVFRLLVKPGLWQLPSLKKHIYWDFPVDPAAKKDSMLPRQGAQVRSQVSELEPTCRNWRSKIPRVVTKTHGSQINTFSKIKINIAKTIMSFLKNSVSVNNKTLYVTLCTREIAWIWLCPSIQQFHKELEGYETVMPNILWAWELVSVKSLPWATLAESDSQNREKLPGNASMALLLLRFMAEERIVCRYWSLMEIYRMSLQSRNWANFIL